ncbi:carboxypeptidase regulatory-like domain-containing protein [Myxococcaceae bacterium GXIMD 01537]
MRNGSRVPFLIAATLGLAAVLLLWSRPARTTDAPPRTAPLRPPAPAATAARPRAPRSTPPLEVAATEAQGAFAVRVVTQGRPVAGAQVWAALRGPEDGTGRTRWRRAAEGVTGEDGTLKLPAAPGFYLLSARAEGHGPARQELARPVGEAETRVELTLAPAVELRGRVVAEGRSEPVPLAEVRLSPYTRPASPDTEPGRLPELESTTVCDAEGRFTLSGLAPGRYELVAEAPGFSRRTLRLLAVPRADEVVVGLWASAVLEGFVVDARGQPAPGAEVVALGGSEPLRTSTGEGGGFSLEVPGGTYALTAHHAGARGRVPGLLVAAPGETLRGLKVRLGPAGGFEGTVLAADGRPVRGAQLVASPAGAAGVAGEARTAEDGRYTLDLPPGEYDVVALAEGHTATGRRGLAVNAGARAPLDFRLEGAARVEGTVTDEGGRPLAGVHVRAGLAQGVTEREAYTLTDAAGAYRLEGLEVGMTRVSARRDTSAVWLTRTAELTTGASARVDFALGDTGIVQGRVRQASGERLMEPALVRAHARGGQGGAAEWAFIETNAEGDYQLELPGGVYQLTAVRPGTRYVYFHEDDLSVTVAAGSASVVDLMLTEDEGLRGVVLEPSGAPSPGATVAALQGGDFPMTVTVRTDEDGRFGLPPRGASAPPLDLRAYNAGRLGEADGAREGGEGAVIRLRAAAQVRGRVVARSGAAPEGFTLRVLEADGSVPAWASPGTAERTFTGHTFVLYDAPAQALKLAVRTSDGRVGEAAVTLSPGEVTEVEVLLTGGAASISGRAVWNASGSPAEGVALFLDRQAGTGADTRTGKDGRFRLGDVRPGVHTVRLLAPDGRPETRTVKVADGEAVDVGDVSVAARPAASGTVGAGFSEERGAVAFAWLTPEGPAALAGVHVGDLLVAVNGVAVRNRQEAESRTRGTPGTPVRLEVRRGSGEQHHVQLTRAD